MVDYIHLVWHMVDIIYHKIIFSITVIMLLPVTSKQRLCRIFIMTIGLLSKERPHTHTISLYLSNTHLLVLQTLTQTHGKTIHTFGDYWILLGFWRICIITYHLDTLSPFLFYFSRVQCELQAILSRRKISIIIYSK